MWECRGAQPTCGPCSCRIDAEAPAMPSSTETKLWQQKGQEAMGRLSGLRLETAQRRCKCSCCCLALQLLPCMVIPRNIRADQPCLGWRVQREAVPWLWDVLRSPCPTQEAEERPTGKVGWKPFYLQSCPGCANITSATERAPARAGRRVCKPLPKGK